MLRGRACDRAARRRSLRSGRTRRLQLVQEGAARERGVAAAQSIPVGVGNGLLNVGEAG